MSNEISSVLKPSPMTVIKNDKQAEPRATPSEMDESSRPSATESVTAKQLQVSTVSTEDEKLKEAKKAEKSASLDELKKIVEEGNSLLQIVRRNLQFKVDDATDELVVKVIDSESGEVVRQIPSDELLALIQRMKEQEGQQESQGLMIRDRV